MDISTERLNLTHRLFITNTSKNKNTIQAPWVSIDAVYILIIALCDPWLADLY